MRCSWQISSTDSLLVAPQSCVRMLKSAQQTEAGGAVGAHEIDDVTCACTKYRLNAQFNWRRGALLALDANAVSAARSVRNNITRPEKQVHRKWRAELRYTGTQGAQ